MKELAVLMQQAKREREDPFRSLPVAEVTDKLPVCTVLAGYRGDYIDSRSRKPLTEE